MNFDIAQLFLGISSIKVNDLEIVTCADFSFAPDAFQIECKLAEFKDTSNLPFKLQQLNDNLQEVKKLKNAGSITFTFVDWSNTSYDFIFKDVSLKFGYECDLVLMVINYNPTKFEIKKVIQ
jgi:hypothetical protein